MKLPQNIKKILINVGVMVGVYLLVGLWQTRNLLSEDDGVAPGFELVDLQGKSHRLGGNPQGQGDAVAKPALVYFFAPWCSVCDLTSSNVEDLKASFGDDLEVLAVALSYSGPAAVRKFADNHQLKVPVLLGHDGVGLAYKVAAYPTFYFIDPEGKIAHKTMGYTSMLGLWLRSYFMI
tara:strand:- start:594 stop:1127 length:534 start_codon:yes stop_codon:yes gene_type:complete